MAIPLLSAARLARLFGTTRGRRRRSRANVGLQLEALEDRLTPAVAANQVFVASLYQGLLGRAAEPAGLAFWTSQLSSGASRQDVANGIEASPEFAGREVQLFFTTFLGRSADQAAVNFFGSALLSGTPVEQVKAEILGSDEFFARVGGSMNNFLNQVFEHALGRGLDAFGQAFFAGTPADTAGRVNAALEILTSPEANGVRVIDSFRNLLGRNPDPAGLSFWVNQIGSGASNEALVAGIAGSTEFLTDIETDVGALTATDANTAARLFIIDHGLFSGPLPGEEQLAGNIQTSPAIIFQTNTQFGGPVLLPTIATAGGAVAIAAFQGGTVTVTTAPLVTPTPFPSTFVATAPSIYQDTVAFPTYTGDTSIYQDTTPIINQSIF
jgi:hypothetical protein